MSADDDALEIARALTSAGVPVFVAYPNDNGDFTPPKNWQNTTPNPAYIDAWRPGLALCAVMGHGIDLVDIDPRNGGNIVPIAGMLPPILGTATSPSGGQHVFVQSLGVRSRDSVMPGLDVKAGDEHGIGRGFAFIAPTIRISKTSGQPVAYHWVMAPDTSLINGRRATSSQLADLVRGARQSRQMFAGPEPLERKHAGPVPYGEHHSQIIAYAGWLRSKAIPLQPEAETLMLRRLQDLVQPADATRPRYTETEALTDLHDVYSRYAAGDPAAEQQTDTGTLTLPETLLDQLLPGGAILDVPAIPDTVWGDDNGILWAVGQALILAGPDGVGKTTVAGNLIEARLGLGNGYVLGLPVRPGDRNILLLLMDRPQQAMAALARLFTESQRTRLDTCLRIWRGPPPHDLARDTSMLARLCTLADADTCVVDSLKDAALKLTEDEAGSGWNRARQIAIEAGTQLLELHHPRKGQDGNRKPSKLDDLYGSRWISAGAGSVVSLWGQAGDPVIELTHLKPVTEPVGPWQMTIDGTTGRIARDPGIDLLSQIRARGSNGITVQVAATLLSGKDKPDRNDIERARRRLDKHVSDELLTKTDGARGGNHGSNHATYFLQANTEAITSNHVGHVSAGQSNHGPITGQEEPEQSRGTPHTKWGFRVTGPPNRPFRQPGAP